MEICLSSLENLIKKSIAKLTSLGFKTLLRDTNKKRKQRWVSTFTAAKVRSP